MVHPQTEGEEAERHHRGDDPGVSHDRPAGEDRQHRRDHARGRQENDVDLRVAEQPEQVLPEQRVAAAFRVEERPVEGAFHLEQDRAEDQGREAAEHHQRRDEKVPSHERHACERHAGRAHLEDRHHDLDRGRDGGDLDEGDAEQPDVGSDPRRIGPRRERRVHEPAAVRRDPEGDGAEHDRAADEIAPIAEGREPRKREVARAQQFGQQVDRQAFDEGDGEKEHHHRSMHGDDLTVGVRSHERVAGQGELGADEHRENAGRHEEHERRQHEASADDGVVHRGEARPTGRRAPDGAEFAVQAERSAARGGDVRIAHRRASRTSPSGAPSPRASAASVESASR